MIDKQKKYELEILDGNCNGEADYFADFVRNNYPNVEVNIIRNTSGISGGLFCYEEDDMEYLNDVENWLWAQYCGSGLTI